VGRRRLVVQDLERYCPTGCAVFRAVDHTHPAPAGEAFDLESPGDDDDVGHGAS
jgi:hypothetical protein